jgi:hypothetical protein
LANVELIHQHPRRCRTSLRCLLEAGHQDGGEHLRHRNPGPLAWGKRLRMQMVTAHFNGGSTLENTLSRYEEVAHAAQCINPFAAR